MTALPNPFLSAASFPAAVEAAAAHAHAPREAAAAINSNSAGEVMLSAGSAVIEPCQGAVAAAPISRITHNPVTQAVEVRPVSVSPGECGASHNSGECELSVMPAFAPGESTDCIGEIFHFARKLLEEEEDIRRAEDFINWDELEAELAEPLPLFIRDDGYLKRRA